jgi:hypothetical protein
VKNTNTFILLLFLTMQIAFGQETVKELHGVITVDHRFVEAVNVRNLTREATTSTDAMGNFIILAKEGDVLAFSAVNLVTLRKSVDKQDMMTSLLKIEMMYTSIPLKEVIIQEPSKITAESVGVIPYGQKKYTQAERKLYTATSGGGIDGLLNAISGRKAMLKKVIVVEGKQSALNSLVYLFEDSYYTDRLHIPLAYINGFQYYCVDNPELVTAVKEKNKSLIKFTLSMLAPKYLKTITDEN